MKREYREIKLSDIVLTKDNKRKIDEKSESFINLKNSIQAGGVRVPIQVRVHPEKKDRYELRYGERRYRACKALGMSTIPAIVTDNISEAEAFDLTYIENKFREDLKPLEEAEEVALLMERFGGDAKAVGRKIGRNAQWVYVRANISKGLIKDWRNVIEKDPVFKKWTISHLCQIARLPKHIQKELLEAIKENYMLDPETTSAVELGEYIGKVLHLLKKAKWQLDDETLVPKAGACTKCPKRAGHHPLLWFDSEDQVDAGDQCLDGLCWNSKYSAWLQRRAKELKQKHPDLVFIAKEHPNRREAELIGQTLGSYLSHWDYKSVSKSKKGAKPAMHVQGKAAGKLTYIKINCNIQSDKRIKGVPTPLKERRQKLDAKRWSQVLLDLREKVKQSTVNDITYPDKIAAVMTLVAGYGNQNLLEQLTYKSRVEYDEEDEINQNTIAKLAKSKTPQSKTKALELLWNSFLPTLDHLLTYFGPVTQTPKVYQDNAKWIAELLGIDIKLLFEDVSQRKGFTEPKSWANLNEDGTPKKSKSVSKAKGKSSKKDKSKKSNKKVA